MRIVSPSVTLLHFTPDPERVIERAGRVCYKSEDRITDESAGKFIRMLLDPSKAHESVIEHASAGFHIVTDRGISHEIVRHRIASFSQESTRYCCYSKDKFGNEISVVKPLGLDEVQAVTWFRACEEAEHLYFNMIQSGASPQNARSVLPTCLKTEIVMSANFREWRHFLRMRLSTAAHPDIRIIAAMIRDSLVRIAPNVFFDFAEQA